MKEGLRNFSETMDEFTEVLKLFTENDSIENISNLLINCFIFLKQLGKMAYYSILIGYRKNDLETKMLLNLRKSQWDYGLRMVDSKKMDEENLKKIEDIGKMAEQYSQMIENEINKRHTFSRSRDSC